MKIFCVGRNYVAHAKELGNDVPEEPVIFIKPKTALCLPDKPYFYPEFTNELHYECEIVLRICKNGRYINERHSSQYYNQVTAGIDFTARDIQQQLKQQGLPWEKAKGFDQSALVGKWFGVEEVSPKKGIAFSLKKNGETVQTGNTNDMLFSIDRIIADISNYFTLNIGDMIFTGTPEGVGECVVGDVLQGYIGSTEVFKVDIR
ncbi:MAG: fumarylacetoacetate hydrolase family protein [Dinghuibacter sp.]|nr:fumarylacetoacetate hydrolase family protein [Dinghuibacter sp.]